MEIKSIQGVCLEQALLNCTDCGIYPNIFDIKVGSDFRLETEPELRFEIKSPRTVNIIIDSFIGYCGGAKHYYARIEADGIDIVHIKTDETGKTTKFYIGGYICEEWKNKERKIRDLWEKKYTIEIDTRVSNLMKELDPETWEDYDVGDKTNRFNEKQDAIDTAIMVASARFPGWRIILTDETY